VTLLHEELEALRLADLEAVIKRKRRNNWASHARRFSASSSTARRKVVQALVDGAAAAHRGGTFRVAAVCWQSTTADIAGRSRHGSGWGNRPAAPPATAPRFDVDETRR
jgi:hypothetical protein